MITITIRAEPLGPDGKLSNAGQRFGVTLDLFWQSTNKGHKGRRVYLRG